MKNNDTIKIMLGILLLSKTEETRSILNKLKREWFPEGKPRQVLDVIRDLTMNDEESNLLTVTMKLRKKFPNNQHLPAYISSLTNNVNTSDFLSVDTIATILKVNHLSTEARNVETKLNHIVSADDIDFNKYLETLNDAIKKYHEEMVIEEKSITELIDDVVVRHDQAKRGELTGLRFGWRNIDSKIVLEPVDMMVVAGRPAMGKTSFAVALLCQLAFHNNQKVAFFNLEMSNQQMVRRIIGNLAGVDSNKLLRGECTEDELYRIHKVKQNKKLDNIMLFEDSHSITEIQMRMSELKYNNKVDCFIVDYLQKVHTDGNSKFEQVTKASNGIKYISQNLKIPSIALAQLSRSVEQRGGDKRPMLSDLRDSGEIEQDASIISFLHRPEYYGHMENEDGPTNNLGEFIVAKNRNGSTGIEKFNVDLATSSWTMRTGTNMAPNSDFDNDDDDDKPWYEKI